MYAIQKLYFACIFCMLIYWTSPIQEILVQINVTKNKVVCEFGSSFSNEGSKDLKVETNLQCDLSSVPVPCGVISNQQCRDKLTECHLLQGDCDDRNNNTHYCFIFSSDFVGNVCCVVRDVWRCESIPTEQPTVKGLDWSSTVEEPNPIPSGSALLSKNRTSVLAFGISILLLILILLATFIIFMISYLLNQSKKKTIFDCLDVKRLRLTGNKSHTGKNQEETESEFEENWTIKFKSGKSENLPHAMGITIQSVVVGEIVYVGGGGVRSGKPEDIEFTVMKYKLEDKKWSVAALPNEDNQVRYFAMTSVDNNLTLIGGRNRVGRATKQTLVYRCDSDNWDADAYKEAELNIPRDSATAAFYKNTIVVIGGCTKNFQRTDSVEVLEISEKKWKPVQSLPIPRSSMKSTVIEGNLYLMGGMDHNQKHPTKVVYKVNLTDLIDKKWHPQLWQIIRDPPFEHSTPINVNNKLVAIGGRDNKNSARNSIYVYIENGGDEIYDNSRYDKKSMTAVEWVKVGHINNPRYLSAAAVLKIDTANKCMQVIIAGGDIKPEGEASASYIDSVEILTFDM